MAKVTKRKLKAGETFFGGGQGIILRSTIPSNVKQDARPNARGRTIYELVFDGLMHTPHPDFENEITQKISEATEQPGDIDHLAGGVLFWIGRNLDDYNTPEQFTADGQALIHSYCTKEGMDEQGYDDLVEERWIDSDSD